MVAGFIFLAKAIILTEVLTNAARSWGIFDPWRSRLKSVGYFNRLLSCFECTSVWAGAFVTLYLLYFELLPVTYTLCFHRLACFLHLGWETFDAIRAKKEGEI